MPIGRYRAGYHAKHIGVNPIYASGTIFALSVAQDIVSPIFESGEEGDQANYIVAITFSETITSSDFTAGVTIKVDGVTVVVSSADLQSDMRTVYYTITTWAVSNSTVTFTYSDIVGDYADLSGNQMGDIVASPITNNVGRHLRFNDAPNSMHLAWV